MTLRNTAGGKQLEAQVQLGDSPRPTSLLVRLRHPAGNRIRGVTVNGNTWTDFDPGREWVRIPSPGERSYSIIASY